MRTVKQIAAWAKIHNINVERYNSRRIDVFMSGAVICSCENIKETIQAVYEFISGIHK